MVTKKSVKGRGNAKGKKQKPQVKRQVVQVARRDNMADAWLRLLHDPCSSPLARPCYNGADGGYLVRTTDIATIGISYAGTANPSWKGDFAIDIAPWNFSTSTGIVIELEPAGGANTPSFTTGVSNFITIAGSVAREYRPVACCAKFIPTGNYSTRSGVVGRAYAASRCLTAGGTYSVGNVMPGMMRIDACGSVPHEVKWLPTNVDQNYTTTAASDNPGVGTMRFAGLNIDGYQTATTLNISGYFEITTVWEWLPAQATGITSVVAPPNTASVQQVIGRIRDIGGFLFETAHNVGRSMHTAAPYVHASAALLTAGVRYNQARGASMLF